MSYKLTRQDIAEVILSKNTSLAKEAKKSLGKDNITPQELIDYSDKKYGVEESKLGTVKNVMKSLANIPGTVSDYAQGALNELKDDPKDFFEDIYRGGRSYVQNTAAPALKKIVWPSASNLEGFDKLPLEEQKALSKYDFTIPHYSPPHEKNPYPMEEISEFLASLPLVGKTATLGARLGEKLGGAAESKIGKLIAKGAGHAAGGVAGSPFLGVSPEEGALLGLATPLIEKGGKKLLNSSLLNRMFPGVGDKGKLTASEFRKRRELLPKDIKAPLGDIARAPIPKYLYKAADVIFGSGTEKPYIKIGDHLNKTIDKLTTHDVDLKGLDINDYLYNEVKKNYLKAKGKTAKAYDKVKKLSELNKEKFISDPYEQTLEDEKDNLADLSATKAGEYTYRKMANILQRYEKSKLTNFSHFKSTDRALNKNIRDLKVQPGNVEEIALLNRLKNGLEESFEKSAKEFKNPKILNFYEKAKDARKNQAKFEKIGKDKLTPFFRKELKGDPDTGDFLERHIRPVKGTKQNNIYLKNLLSNISAQSRKAAVAHYLSPEGNESLSKILGRLEGLGKNQRAQLLGKEKGAAEKALKIAKLFGDAKNPDFVPVTGYTGNKGRSLYALMTGIITALMTSHPELAFTAAAVPVSANLLQRSLTSNFIKDLYEKGLNKDVLSKVRPKRISVAKISRGLAAQNIRKDKKNES